MYEKGLEELEKISQAVGNSPDLVQGGGGNTSVKLESGLMAVKASGFRLSQVSASEGYVIVDYRAIRDYFEGVVPDSDRDYEKESVDFIKSLVVPRPGSKALRPSVEAGFHSFLKRCVIHTHSVYANLVCCARNGKELMDRIFGGKEYRCVWIPYINPGFCLTLSIMEAIAWCIEQRGGFPDVVFMENHGLIATADSAEECISLHENVNRTIRDHFGISESYPGVEIEDLGGGVYRSKTRFLRDFIKSIPAADYIEKTVLYPDQLVYLCGSVGTGESSKAQMDTGTGELIYRADRAEALTIEETFLAFAYVLKMMERLGLFVKTMSETEIEFIRNWESESYRKSLLKSFAGRKGAE